VSLPRGKDPLTVTLDECIAVIEANAEKANANTVLADYTESGIQVIDGRYGPYLKQDGKNYKIPKGTDVAALTEEKCKEIIEASEPTKRTARRKFTKK